MKNVVIIGGGLAGCGAALAAKAKGARTILIERTDSLGGLGLLAGMVEHHLECPKGEIRAMGGGKIFEVMDNCIIHRNIKYPWPKPDGSINNIHNAMMLDSELKKCMSDAGIEVMLQSRFVDVVMNQNKIQSVILKSKGKKERSVLDVDAVVDATGGAGGMKFCKEHGYGCVGCILRCPTFGSRVSVAARAGVKEKVGLTLFGKEGTLSSAYSLIKASVAPFVRDEIEKNGYGCFPIPKEMVDYERTQSITASGNIDNGFAENLVVIDNGFAKVMAAGFRPLNELYQLN